jgi:hypothetical protein
MKNPKPAGSKPIKFYSKIHFWQDVASRILGCVVPKRGQKSMAPPSVLRILSCCCNRKGHFTVHGTSDRILSVPATFSPRGVVALLIKLLLLCLSITSFIFGVKNSRGSLLFLTYLTNWGLIWTMLYSIMSFTNSIVKIKQPHSNESSGVGDFVGNRAAVTWLLFVIAAHTQMMVSLLYWTLVHQPQWGYSFWNIVDHGGLMMVLLVEGQTMNRIPVRWNHFLFVFMVHFVYLIWTLVYGMYAIGSPDLYDVVDWTGNPKSTFILAAITQLGIVPLVYGVLWLISLPCRRYKNPPKQKQDKSKPGGTVGDQGCDEEQQQQEAGSGYTRLTDDSSTILSSETILLASKRDRLWVTAEV